LYLPRGGSWRHFDRGASISTLVDQHIGLEEIDDGIRSIYFNTILLATLDDRDYIIRG
jgi:hypothetical protein